MPEQKVLLVEDQKSPMRVLRDALKKEGLQVTVVTSAFDALDELNTEGADAVIAAIKLPDMSGCQLSALLRASRATENLPIILVADKGDEKDYWLRAAHASSVVDYREVEFDEVKTVTNLKKLLDEAAKKPRPFELAEDHSILPGEYAGADLVRSQQSLVGALLIDRSVASFCRGLIESMDDRVEFMRRFFTYLEKTFQADLIGLVFNDPAAPWGMYQVKPAISKTSFEETVTNAAKIVEMRANQRMIVSNELAETGGDIKMTEVLTIRMGGPQVVGALLFGWTESRTLDDLAKETLSQLRLHMQSVMRVLQHRQEVQALQQQQQYWSSTDQVTGLYNLEFLMGFLNQQLLFSNRHGLPVGVIIVDVDNFLQFNTELGTEAGDRVLQNIAQKLSTVVRSSDLVARYAGDQFAVVLPNSDLEGAKLVGEKLRSSIEILPIAGLNGHNLKVTISVGCAEFDKTRDINPETVLRDAKLALGRAKEKGRNCVAV